MQRNEKGIVIRPTKLSPGPTRTMSLWVFQEDKLCCDFCLSYNVKLFCSNKKEFSRGLERVGANICEECVEFIYKEGFKEPLSTSG